MAFYVLGLKYYNTYYNIPFHFFYRAHFSDVLSMLESDVNHGLSIYLFIF
jgi:hypothetical protein